LSGIAVRTLARLACAVLLMPVVAAAAGSGASVADAAKAGDLNALRVLLRQHANVNAPEPDGSTALHWAAHRGDLTAVDMLLEAGARVEAANRYGVTPLMLAAEKGHAPIVQRLIRSGANPNVALEGGETVLMTAAREGRTAAVNALLEAGADANARESTRGQTALMWAAGEGHADVITLLIARGAKLATKSHGPSSPKDITTGDSAYLRVAPRVDVATALLFAVHAGQVDAAKVLLDAGANIAEETPQGMGLLTLAVANAHFDVAALLIERGADVNAANIGWTALHQVVRVRTLNIGWGPPHPKPSGRLGGLDVAKLLLQHGADVDARTTKTWQDGYRGMFAVNATPLLLAAKGGDAEMMWLLAAHGADVTATNANGTTVLMAAAGAEMMNPNEDSGRDLDGLAALKVALSLGAGDINGTNRAGDTPLHASIGRVSPAIARALVEKGARLDAKNRRGLMPIDMAIGVGTGVSAGSRPETAKMLREAMLARGLTPPDAKEDTDKFKFGVTVNENDDK
jgi:ankyrin repeat protein